MSEGPGYIHGCHGYALLQLIPAYNMMLSWGIPSKGIWLYQPVELCEHLRPVEMFPVMLMCFRIGESGHRYDRYTVSSGKGGANDIFLQGSLHLIKFSYEWMNVFGIYALFKSVSSLRCISTQPTQSIDPWTTVLNLLCFQI